MTFVLGLTGGIATGKSTISHYFRQLGIPVIDADEVARKVMKPGEASYEKVTELFGSKIINEDHTLNRKLLGEIVFNDSTKLAQLNAVVQSDIYHEIIRMKKKITSDDIPVLVLDIPLLFEAGYENEVDEVMVVYTTLETQVKRLTERDDLPVKEAMKRIEAQESIESKKEKADIIIDNNGSIEESLAQVNSWLTKKGYSFHL